MVQQLYHQPVSTARRRPQRRRQYFLLAGWGLAALSLLTNLSSHFQTTTNSRQNQCQNVVQPSAVLSRGQLAKILTVPERSSQQKITEIVAEPYCQLPPIELRAGVAAKRDAYPLAFAPSTWLVMLYEDDEYAGFSFSFQGERN